MARIAFRQKKNNTVTPNSDTVQCDAICKNLADALSSENPTQTLPAAQKSCHNTCKPMMENKCGILATTLSGLMFQSKQVGDNIQYICTTGGSGGGSNGGARTCNLDFDSLAKNLKLDTPISLAGCNKNTVTYIQGIEKLKHACRLNNSIMVLRKNNKTVEWHRVEEPKPERDSFTCKSMDWFPVGKNILNHGRPSTEWAVEAEPQDCSKTCEKIKPYTKIDGEYYEGREFPGDPQCIKACEKEALESCKNVIHTTYGTKQVTRITSLNYRLDQNNVIRYNCNYETD